MTDYRIFGASWAGPDSSSYYSYSNQVWSVGLEFYVNQPMYWKYAHYYRCNSRQNAAIPFQLYKVNDPNGGTPIQGGAGTIPSGGTGWGTGQTNPILLVPGVRYMLRMDLYYATYVDYSFGSGQTYGNGVGNSVIFAPGASQALSGQQGSYNGPSTGYPNTGDRYNDNFCIDVTVTDQGFPTPLILGSYGSLAKKAAATSNLNLSAIPDSHKQVIAAPVSYLNLRSSGRVYASDSLVGVSRLILGSSGSVQHAASTPGHSTLTLGSSGKISKHVGVKANTTLVLDSPMPTDFWRGVADNVRDALLAQNWNTERHHFQEAAQLDAESLGADVFGGLFALSIGDHERAHETVRHLRNYRVKGQQIGGGHYRNSHDLMGYKPYGSLGASPHQTPPPIIDQAYTWLAEIFKGNYNEPIGDDVRSLLDWYRTYIAAGPSRLWGAQFLNFNRTIWTSNYKIVARPQLDVAAWAFLAASGSPFLFPIDALPRPQIDNLQLLTNPIPNSNKHQMIMAWHVVDDVPVSAFNTYLEHQVGTGPWRPLYQNIAETQSHEYRRQDQYAGQISVLDPSVTTQYRMWVRARNATYGEWQHSNVVTIHSPNSAVYPSPTTFPSPTLYPEG